MKHLKILAHPIFTSLSFHMPMVLDLSHPLIMLEGENGSGKSTLLHSIYHALQGEQIDGYVYKLQLDGLKPEKILLFDAEQHNPRNHPELFDEEPEMREFVETASHGQVMLSLFQQTFPGLPDGTILLLDEPEMALSQSNQRRVVKMLKELVDAKNFRIIAATHSPHLLASPETYVINLDRHVNRNVIRDDFGVEGGSTIH
jgi:predicted ATPase